MIGFVLGLLLIGLVIGALARLLVPGRDRMGIGATILLGIVGSIVSGIIGRLVFDSDGTGFLLALVTTVCVLLVWRRTAGSRA